MPSVRFTVLTLSRRTLSKIIFLYFALPVYYSTFLKDPTKYTVGNKIHTAALSFYITLPSIFFDSDLIRVNV